MDLDQIIQDFEDDGELDPRNVSHDNQGAAAYIKFKLEPNEIREIPCVVAWHYPYFATGDLAGEPKFYVQHLGRFRPDNAIVWLAEQAYEDYGTEAATYTHWMRQISDWHATIKDSMELDNLVRLRSSGLVGTADSGWKLYGNKASDELISAFSEAELVTLNSWPDLWEAVRN